MGTRNMPGRFDFYWRALPDEPLFTLIARDPLAPLLVDQWAAQLEALGIDAAKVAEARQCAEAMRAWRREHYGDEIIEPGRDDAGDVNDDATGDLFHPASEDSRNAD